MSPETRDCCEPREPEAAEVPVAAGLLGGNGFPEPRRVFGSLLVQDATHAVVEHGFWTLRRWTTAGVRPEEAQALAQRTRPTGVRSAHAAKR